MFDQIKTLLQTHNARFRIVEHAAEGQSEKVAAIRGTEVGQGAKAMLCQSKDEAGKLILAILPGDQKIDFKKLATAVQVKKTSFAAPEAAMERTGCVIGAIPPFVFSDDIQLVLDPSLVARYAEIAFNAGRLDKSIILNTEDYLRIAKPILHDICAV
ncbi:YbaK/prolyl-tRNA synthetase associated domain-containing protein [Undibacterium umbellatum]|uniref:YbaK/prolyl-tRNA synthetase associated domain-containing protein n=1 Tax=Undibacterium umbellatum TaxID=2762300 RepID=A0ABR6ZDS3_9BURK|nr:YbaK/prolyl-tRNA synthetase associated domain-containing protein [Undibacterium umbellatum]MBC3909731.1 YbaK/prolyl-tRNA synthetase associated domain-containing protein [Undibacterium umbellatum]